MCIYEDNLDIINNKNDLLIFFKFHLSSHVVRVFYKGFI